MKNTIKILSLLFITLFAFSSCSKDDDPTDNSLFVGKYNGTVRYSEGLDEIKTNANGSVTVSKIGDTYNFNFSDAIPSLNGIKMEKGQGNVIIFNDGALGSISISASELDINYTKDGKTWSANCER
ncbi:MULTISPECIES: hypothetical protein [Sphingobacterium]|jgi:hypothetical protein|uniref:Lipocalin-like domain-containing protein n=1 Tax=Sphingobacterium litopenaei TaxID=2763500 RepID=A0ABR7YHV4_9SPHI|nr:MULTISPECIES: hypothetical protein [Sphingobacterium]MBD1430892.1 hypothetical protein [Sphingobacterium litopenaei]NGM74758.1 hypothetical protein [Sphingobacterium sp. SGL-16]